MGKTAFNPITSQWSGKIGGFTYSVRDGNQIISKVASSKRDPKSVKQMQVRMRFKLASQFTKLWDSLLLTNLAKIESNASKGQNLIRKVAFHSTTAEDDTALLRLEDFENRFNAETQQVASADLMLLFTATTQSITAPDGDIVAYQIVAFDQNSTPIGYNVVTYVSDGTAKQIDLPAIRGEAVRYDIITFNTSTTGASSWAGPIGNINGNDPFSIDAEVYSVLMSELSSSNSIIHGIVTGSYLVA